MILIRIARSTVTTAVCGLALGAGCSGVHQRPWLFPNRANKAAAARGIGSPKVELRPPSGDLAVEPATPLPPLHAPVD